MECNTLVVLQSSIEGLHNFFEQVASLFERHFVQLSFIRLCNWAQVIDWTDRDVLDEVFVHSDWSAKSSLL